MIKSECMEYAPIVIFVYNRPAVLAETLNALKTNKGIENHKIIFFCDGPKEGITEKELDKVQKVRLLAKEVSWSKETIINISNKNIGLADSIVNGITSVLEEYETVIVLEDDIKTSPWFLKYMSDALQIYRNEEKVISISGYNYPIEDKNNTEETFFIRGADCWGWATWRRGWKLYEGNGQKLLDQLIANNEIRNFDFNDSYSYSKMLQKTILVNHSWAVKWYASAYLKNCLTLYPKYSLVDNIGIEGTNSNIKNSKLFGNGFYESPITIFSKNITESTVMKNMFSDHLRKYFSIRNRITLLFKEKGLIVGLFTIAKISLLKFFK